MQNAQFDFTWDLHEESRRKENTGVALVAWNSLILLESSAHRCTEMPFLKIAIQYGVLIVLASVQLSLSWLTILSSLSCVIQHILGFPWSFETPASYKETRSLIHFFIVYSDEYMPALSANSANVN